MRPFVRLALLGVLCCLLAPSAGGYDLFDRTRTVTDGSYSVTAGGASVPVYAFKSEFHGGVYYAARFPLDGRAEILVRCSRSFRNVRILSGDDNLRWSVTGDGLLLRAARPFKAVVEVEGRVRPLILSAERPDREEAPAPSGKVRVFGPGEHHPGLIRLGSGDILWLAEGAVVHGGVYASGDGIRILGHGILTGESWPRKGGPQQHLFMADGCRDLEVRGVTFTAPWLWTLMLRNCDRPRLENVCVFASNMINDDALDLCNCRDAVVRDCILRCQDDAVAVKGMDTAGLPCARILVERCLLWSDRANICRIGYECDVPYMKDITVRDCFVAHHSFVYRGGDQFWANTLFYVQPSDGKRLSDITFERIRVHADGRCVLLKAASCLCRGPRTSGAWYTEGGAAHGILLRDIDITGGCGGFEGSVWLEGRSASETVSGVTLQRVRIGGRRIRQDFPYLHLGPFAAAPAFSMTQRDK